MGIPLMIGGAFALYAACEFGAAYLFPEKESEEALQDEPLSESGCRSEDVLFHITPKDDSNTPTFTVHGDSIFDFFRRDECRRCRVEEYDLDGRVSTIHTFHSCKGHKKEKFYIEESDGKRPKDFKWYYTVDGSPRTFEGLGHKISIYARSLFQGVFSSKKKEEDSVSLPLPKKKEIHRRDRDNPEFSDAEEQYGVRIDRSQSPEAFTASTSRRCVLNHRSEELRKVRSNRRRKIYIEKLLKSLTEEQRAYFLQERERIHCGPNDTWRREKFSEWLQTLEQVCEENIEFGIR